MNAKLAIIN